MKKATIYGTSRCVQCKFASQILTAKGYEVEYHDVDIDAKAKAFVQSLYHAKLPTIVIGDNVISGLDIDRIKEVTE